MLVALGNRVLSKTPSGSWPTQPQSRVAYQGEFDPVKVPVEPTVRSSEPNSGYQSIAGPKALAYHPWGRIFLGTGINSAAAATGALKACNADPVRNGADGPCFLYAIGDQVVLPRRYTEAPHLYAIGDKVVLPRRGAGDPFAQRTVMKGYAGGESSRTSARSR